MSENRQESGKERLSPFFLPRLPPFVARPRSPAFSIVSTDLEPGTGQYGEYTRLLHVTLRVRGKAIDAVSVLDDCSLTGAHNLSVINNRQTVRGITLLHEILATL